MDMGVTPEVAVYTLNNLDCPRLQLAFALALPGAGTLSQRAPCLRYGVASKRVNCEASWSAPYRKVR